VVLKASASRNYRFPTLNDLYFLPGGNPDLRHESGWSDDGGMSFAIGREGVYKLSGSATWFDSYINDWIIWLPTTKGFFSPENVKDVHAYGVELDGHLSVQLAKHWLLNMDATFSWTPSINHGEKRSPADQSVGKQLPYIPELSSTVAGRLTWREWSFVYNWCFYSERYTMSSNDISLTGKLPKYYMSNISLGYNLALRWADFNFKGTINNVFDEEYLSVLSRPMPGINFELFVGITPKW
jgi:iron complex outermembrane receptor protein